MKRFLFTILCLSVFSLGKAQTPAELPDVVIESATAKVDTSERAPAFVGGVNQLMNYLRKNQRTLSNSDTHGRVIVSFVIEKDGSVTEAKILKGVSDEADTEALRLIKKMPKWEPGIQNNTPVRVRFSMPIAFQ